MAQTGLASISTLVQNMWAPLIMDQLRAELMLGSLVNKDYDGIIRQKGDRVKVSIVNTVAGQTIATSTSPLSFTPAAISATTVNVIADQCFIASVQVDDIVDLQSQIDKNEPKLLEALKYGLMTQINTYLYGKVSASLAAPDHRLESVATLDNAQLLAIRELAAAAAWKRDGWYGLLSPGYYSDVLSASTLVSSDFVPDQPVVGGVLGARRYGFQIFEDATLSSDRAVFFHPDFLIFATQMEPEFKISDRHPNNELGYVMSVHLFGGAAQGPQGNVKHISVSTAAGAWAQ